jgi:heptosyltransferase-2
MGDIEKIIVKSVNWVGDAIMTTPTIRRLRQGFPQARIAIIARPAVAPVFENNPDVDEVWREEAANGGGLRGARRELIDRLRREQFDLGLALPNSFGAAHLLWAGGVRRRVGYARDLRSLFLTDRVPCTRTILSCHQVEYYLNLLHCILNVDDEPRELILELDDAVKSRVDALLEERGVGSEERLIGINPGAFYGTAKRWLPERFAETADRLARSSGGRIVLNGSAAERETAEEIARMCEAPAVNLAGVLSLTEAVALIDRCAIFITNDSGGMHLAAARNAPTVAIFGSTDWRTTYPYSPAARLVRHDTSCAPCLLRECPIDHRCMTRVTVDEVVAAAEELLVVKT